MPVGQNQSPERQVRICNGKANCSASSKRDHRRFTFQQEQPPFTGHCPDTNGLLRSERHEAVDGKEEMVNSSVRGLERSLFHCNGLTCASRRRRCNSHPQLMMFTRNRHGPDLPGASRSGRSQGRQQRHQLITSRRAGRRRQRLQGLSQHPALQRNRLCQAMPHDQA